MTSVELFIIAVGLSMDAFAVAVCKGLSIPKINWKKMCIIGLYFGFFQAAMPLIGYFLGVSFKQQINQFDHWIAFVLLVIIGGNMIRESFEKDHCSCDVRGGCSSLGFKEMVPLAIATSIDALAAGVTFAVLLDQNKTFTAVTFIGVITFCISVAGVKIGNVFGTKYKSKAEFFGGAILVLMAFKILLEHLNIIHF